MSLAASPPPPTLWRSLCIQGRVIRALLLRETITRFGRRNLGVLWLLVEPMLFTLGISALWVAAGFQQHANLSIAAFALTGYSSVLMWRNTVSQCTDALHANINLLFHRNVTVLDVLLARIALEACGATGSFIVLGVIWVGLGAAPPPADALRLIGGWLMLAWFGAALALLVGAATSYSDIVSRLWKPIAYLLFPLSGAAFMVDWLAPAAQEMALLLPMVHGVEMLRAGYFGDAVQTHYDPVYLAEANLLLLFFGLVLLRNASRRLEAK
ncbi:ABC transporter permease [Aquabacterium sp.]|uniref:ABC transporter permease n=1 Tax=Aquabacterium sp. TaxID=1872578 RepID=UPI002CC382B0|nr:ABC transporter permease [Aquabacterium sp.]HSW07422.1 ABC transporter permease [Aquabacterium sp.]